MPTSPDSTTLETLMPHAAPVDRTGRTLLLAMRRIAAGGLDDAHAAAAMLGTFGMGYRRPLMFLRVLMKEVSRISQQQISIAPCCCRRMTEGEAAFLLIIEGSSANPDSARTTLTRITGTFDTLAAISVAQALADSLDDIGRPFSL